MVVAAFSINYYNKKGKFFKEIFLVANISQNMIFGIFFFILNSINIDFQKREL